MNRFKRSFCLLMSFITLLTAFFAVGVPNNRVNAATLGYVNGSDVWVREAPSTSGKKIMKLSHTYVTVNGHANDSNGNVWYNITYNDITGYMFGQYIRFSEYEYSEDFETSIKNFPESYHQALRNLHALYPNWKFYADNVGLSFNDAINLEAARKLVSSSSSLSWRSMIAGAYNWSNGTWDEKTSGYYVASREVLQYYMDPRNFLTPTNVYSYLKQDYNSAAQNEDGLKKIISNSFMANNYAYNPNDPLDSQYGGSYVKVIMAAAAAHNVNPYILAAKIIVEQGWEGTSSLISGTYSGYEGYYNFFNIKATGSTSNEQVIKNGLNHAVSKGWDSRADSIFGGAEFLKTNYIGVGQNTYFYMNFNIKQPDRLWHQYAESVYDTVNSAGVLAKNYKDATDESLEFIIPVYSDMPSTPMALPEKNNNLNNYYFTNISVSGLTPTFDMFTYKYDLHISGDTTVSVSVPANASYVGAANYPLNEGNNTVTLKVKSQTGYITDYNIYVNADTPCILYIDSGSGVTNVEVKSGDTNFDGQINGRDAANIQMHILGIRSLVGSAFKGADTNGDGQINGRDAANVQMHILGIKSIS